MEFNGQQHSDAAGQSPQPAAGNPTGMASVQGRQFSPAGAAPMPPQGPYQSPPVLQYGAEGAPFPSNSDVLRMRGLPYTATDEDVRAFYEGYELDPVNPIVIISQGYHRGEGFVKFKSVEQCAEAFSKLNRQCIGPRYIELYPSTESAMNLAAAQLQAMGNQKNFIIRLRGLPFQATDVNIYEFFSDVTNQIASVQICTSFDGRSTGDAFVELTTQEALQLALEKNRSMLGPRYIEVFVSNAHERDVLLTSARRSTRGRARGGAFAPPIPAGRGRGGAIPVGPYQSVPRQPSSFVVRVRGLPYTTTEAQVAEFFHDVKIAAQGVHLVYNAQEKPTGEAFVEVLTEQDVNLAMHHNGAALGHRYIEVFRSSGADMGRLAGAEETYAVPVHPQYLQPQYAIPPGGFTYATAPQAFTYAQPQAHHVFVPQQQVPSNQVPPQMQSGRPTYSWSGDLPPSFAPQGSGFQSQPNNGAPQPVVSQAGGRGLQPGAIFSPS